MKTAVIWFTQDLRTYDNPCLEAASSADQAVCIYCVDPTWFSPGPQQAKPMGSLRWRFVWESLNSLAKSLALHGQKLHILYGPPEQIVTQVVSETAASDLYLCRRFGCYESHQVQQIKQLQPEVNVHQLDSYTLFQYPQIRPLLQYLPCSFSAFRRQLQALDIPQPCQFNGLPPALHYQPRSAFRSKQPVNRSPCPFSGGETEAIRHISGYFRSDRPQRYKQTRNQIDGWESSTKFSAWLNQGCISPRYIAAQLQRYEALRGENAGTEWILVELLWREFFQWLSEQIDKDLYTFAGLSEQGPLSSFYPERFKAWCEGKTPWPVVNACMRQLSLSGYLSNRGRQIAASALVNELALDWRYGAAWFQEHLIDYDVASNWGNWQYIAGVGVDSRGGRHFNLAKQASLYDPDGQFARRWGGPEAFPQIDYQDPTGWPLSSY